MEELKLYYNQIVCAELKTSNDNVDDMLPIQFQFAQNVEKSSDFKLLRMRIQLFTKKNKKINNGFVSKFPTIKMKIKP